MTDRLFVWVKGSCLLLYLARGWRLEAIDERYWSVLLSREAPAAAPEMT